MPSRTNRDRITFGILPRALGSVAACVATLVVASCGGPSLPPPTAPNSLPAKGILRGTPGVVRLDLAAIDEASLSRWLGLADRTEFDRSDALARKVLLARNGLSELGITAAVLPIPTLEPIPEEWGIYLAGPSGLDREAIEDVFLRAGGLNIGGFAMANAFAKEIEDGWYFFGWGIDGALDEYDAGRAAALCAGLADTPAAPATLLVLADGSDWIDADELPNGEARAARRARALAEAVRGMRAMAVCAGSPDGVVWNIRFETPADAEAAQDAVRRVIKDVDLMAEGSLAVGELDEYDLLGWHRIASAAEMTVTGSTLAVRPAAQ